MLGNSLPPVRNVPQWSRVGCLDKSCFPHPRPRPPNHLELTSDNCLRDIDEVASLRRNIEFLQLEHKDTLQKLHAEIDNLRRDNKELQYKLIMEPSKLLRTGSSRRCKKNLTEAQKQSVIYLERSLQNTCPSRVPGLRSTAGDIEGMSHTTKTAGVGRHDHKSSKWGGLITSLQPLQVHSSPSHPPRVPTLPECEIIIQQLYNANSLQSQEIIHVKSVLQDIVFNKKITPEIYTLTKAYLADSTSKVDVLRFPQLAQLPKRMCGDHARGTDMVVLPALTQSLSSNMAVIQKRTQAVQRGRLRRTVH
ncbi:hypothetical protein UPYG_G00281040 [Umbra pygmaea]|uniref:Uncharacterized protein n=1 Tax=Umbra pygmaea TaxID=75934 RepID=A0ABD0W350_UMBPY